MKSSYQRKATHEGMQHWVVQRICAIALIPLSLFLIISMSLYIGSNAHDAAEHWLAWVKDPYNMIALILFFITAYIHALHGLEVVIEDYMHGARRIALLLAVKLIMYGLLCVSIFAIFMIAFQEVV